MGLVMTTSAFEQYVSRQLASVCEKYTVWRNYRPEWLMGANGRPLELDFFIEELGVGIEVQGRQHYEFVTAWHKNEQAFKDQIERDRLKRELCKARGVELHEVYTETDADRIANYLMNFQFKSEATIQLVAEWGDVKRSLEANREQRVISERDARESKQRPAEPAMQTKPPLAQPGDLWYFDSGWVMSKSGSKLMRLDRATGTMHVFDKKAKAEVAVSVRELMKALSM